MLRGLNIALIEAIDKQGKFAKALLMKSKALNEAKMEIRFLKDEIGAMRDEKKKEERCRLCVKLYEANNLLISRIENGSN